MGLDLSQQEEGMMRKGKAEKLQGRSDCEQGLSLSRKNTNTKRGETVRVGGSFALHGVAWCKVSWGQGGGRERKRERAKHSTDFWVIGGDSVYRSNNVQHTPPNNAQTPAGPLTKANNGPRDTKKE
jgi:hypothetical protein